MQSQKVFVQYKYCSLCRVNHKKGKKHVCSSRHQEIVANVLTKFQKKISVAKETLQKPSVKDLMWSEAEKMFWCYFCQLDVGQHKHNEMTGGECRIEHGGLLEHITREDHVAKTVAFLKEHRQDLKRTPEFIISSSVYLKYLEETELACSHFFKQKAEALNRAAAQIRTQSALRQGVAVSTLMEQSLLEQEKQQVRSDLNLHRGIARPTSKFLSEDEVQGKRTIQAFGEGLTALDRSNEDDNMGNIYTNAPPPWMLPDPEDKPSLSVIGPTMADLEKHRDLEKKRQLPACRVGAKFDHKASQSESWLPNFGGVWSHGRRTDSVKKFQHHQRKNLAKTIQFSESPSAVLQMQPMPSSMQSEYYFFPKIPRTTSTVTSRSAENITVSYSDRVIIPEPAHSVVGSVTTNASNISNHVKLPQNYHQNQNHVNHGNSSWSPAFLEETKSMKSYSSIPVPDQSTEGSYVHIKPYVRKRKQAVITDSQSSLSAVVFHSSQSVNNTFMGTKNYNTEANSVQPYLAESKRTFMTTPMPARSVSGTAVNDTGASNRASMAYQRWNNPAKHEIARTGEQTLRLIATPVLNQKKK